MTRIVNVKRDRCEVYIGRSHSKFHFGNPFRIGADGSRAGVIEKHWRWLHGDPEFEKVDPERRQWILDNLETLRGKKLGCWCAPLPCHGDNYVRMLEETNDTKV